ncbi:MAG: hypothetical protein KC486_28635 [Myxococcales bacterium]|nr:hypothetical protein [Myxococcales bacterium]
MSGRGGPRDEDDDVGDAGELRLPPSALALVLLPDTEAAFDPQKPVLGVIPAQRLVDDALAAGFTAAYAGPGVRASLRGAEELATGDAIDCAALVVVESATIHREILRLMVEHPLEVDERFTIYDDVGRPAAWFTGYLKHLPAVMPVSEEIAWPAEVGPADVARLVYAEDRPRAEAIVRRSRGLDEGDTSLYSRFVAGPLLRGLAAAERPLAQIELVALTLAVSSGALVLLHPWLGAVLGALALLLGVEIARQIPALRQLRGGDGTAFVSEVVVRPFGHAAFGAALTYVLVAEEIRSGAADLVLLGIGGAAVFFSLVQARSLLREQRTVPLELPSSASLAARLGVRWPARWRVPLAIEVLALLLAVAGPSFAWAVMVVAGLARLWRWFASPEAEEDAGAVADRGRPDLGRSR